MVASLSIENSPGVPSPEIPIKKIGISIPIKVPKPSSSDDLVSEYALKCNFFNPGKMSPPDVWKERLELRIKGFYLNKSE